MSECTKCAGEGVIHTGIDEAPTRHCWKCDGLGLATLPAAPAPTDAEAFRAHLKRSSEIQSTWPDWKRMSPAPRTVQPPPFPSPAIQEEVALHSAILEVLVSRANGLGEDYLFFKRAPEDGKRPVNMLVDEITAAAYKIGKESAGVVAQVVAGQAVELPLTWQEKLERGSPETDPDLGYTLDDVDLARRLLTEMGRAIGPSREPGANRDVDRLAALIGANFAARQVGAPTEQDPGEPYMFKLPGDYDWQLGFAPLPEGAHRVTLLVGAPDAQVSKMKWAAIEAHRICYETMLKHPEIVELGDEGVLHRAIHAIVGVETPGCSGRAPDAGMDTRSLIIGQAVAHWRLRWPAELDSGVMFFNGQRITKAEFEDCAAIVQEKAS